MKKITGIMLVMLLCLTGLLMAEGQKDSDTVMIGAAMNSFADKWQTYLQDAVRDFDAQHEDCVIKMTDGKDDPATQLNQVETLITQGIDVLLIVPVDISAMGPVIDKCKEAGVKIVVVNRLPSEEHMNDVDVYVGSESIQAGIMQAEWVIETLNGKGDVAIMMGPLGQEAALMRTEGNKQIIGKNSGINLVAEAEAKWDRALGMQKAENWFQSGSKLDAILCNNDEMAIGTLLAAESAGIADEDIIIAGVDATKDALEYLGKGLDVTVFQSPAGQGWGGAEAAYKLAKGEAVEKMTWIPFELVTLENVEDYK